MSLGSNKTRNDSRENKKIADNLKKHAHQKEFYMQLGWPEEDADRQAFKDVINNVPWAQ